MNNEFYGIGTELNSVPIPIEDRVKLARSLMLMFDEWQIDADYRIALLGLPDDIKPRHMDRYRKGTPFPDVPEVMQRIEHLVAIYDALRTTFPRNARMGRHWLITPNRHFGSAAPLQVMLKEGLNGLETVRGKLDCTVGWI